MACGDFRQIAGWRCQALGKQACAKPAHGPVDRRQQAAAALPVQPPHQFKVGAGRRVDAHMPPRALLLGRHEGCARPFWVALT